MNKIISVNSRKPLGSYIYLPNPRWSCDWPFFLGVALTLALPQIIFAIHFEASALLVLGACEMLGAGVGLNNYRRSPALLPSCAPPSALRTSVDDEIRRKRAA